MRNGELRRPDFLIRLCVVKMLSAELFFKQLPSSYNDDAGLRAEAVRLHWRLAMTVGPLFAHSVHPYSEHRERGHHCDRSHTREVVVVDVAHSMG
jgi:hypothetical protein